MIPRFRGQIPETAPKQVNKHFPAKSQKSLDFNIIKTTKPIWTKFYTVTFVGGPEHSYNKSKMMMMSEFVDRVINSPQTRCQSSKQVGFQMSSKQCRGKSCGS